MHFLRRLVLLLAVLAAPGAHAWEDHRILMPWVLKGLPPALDETLSTLTRLPCKEQDRAAFAKLAQELQLNPEGKLESPGPDVCAEGGPSTNLRAVLLTAFADEPDFGMDQNLDLSPDQEFMGGKTGPTSQGFRHMYFGGWKPTKPLATFQVPTRALGQAPERARIFAERARAAMRADDPFWSARLAAWSMHFVQDLSQPFHSAQIPHLAMGGWEALLGDGFNGLVRATTHHISNYHYAYEGYVLHRLKSGGASDLASCLDRADEIAKWDAAITEPKAIALEVSRRSIGLARELGTAEMAFFGPDLKKPERDLPAGKGVPDDEAMSKDPALAKARERLERVTCDALANGVVASRRTLAWVFEGAK